MTEEISLYVDDYDYVKGYGQTNSLDTILQNIGVIDKQSLEEYKAGIEKIGGFNFANPILIQPIALDTIVGPFIDGVTLNQLYVEKISA